MKFFLPSALLLASFSKATSNYNTDDELFGTAFKEILVELERELVNTEFKDLLSIALDGQHTISWMISGRILSGILNSRDKSKATVFYAMDQMADLPATFLVDEQQNEIHILLTVYEQRLITCDMEFVGDELRSISPTTAICSLPDPRKFKSFEQYVRVLGMNLKSLYHKVLDNLQSPFAFSIDTKFLKTHLICIDRMFGRITAYPSDLMIARLYLVVMRYETFAKGLWDEYESLKEITNRLHDLVNQL